MGEMHGNSDGPALDDEQFCGAVPHGLNGLEKFLQHSASSSATVTRFQVEDEESFVESTCKKYQAMSTIPRLSSAKLLKVENHVSGQKCSILARYSQQDIVSKQLMFFQKALKVHVNWEEKSVQIEESPVFTQPEKVIKQCISNDGKFRSVIRKLKRSEQSKYILEVWSDFMMHRAIDLSAFDVHGDVYEDDTFASLQWSPDCRKILYIAEKKIANSRSYFDQGAGKKKSDEEIKAPKGEEYLYKEDWGEMKNGLCCPVIVIVDVIDLSVRVLDEIPDQLSPGQAIWESNDSIIFVGWWNIPFKLGLVYCSNRRSAIFRLSLNGSGTDCCQLSDDGCSVHSPTISPDLSKLAFLQRVQGGTHEGCRQLMMYDLKQKSKCEVVHDIVQISSDLQIPLYTMSLNEHCWTQNGESIILDTIFKCTKIIVMVELKTGKLTRLTVEDGAWSLQDIHSNLVVATYSTPNVPDKLIIGNLSFDTQVDWIHLSKESSEYYSSLRENIRWEKFCLPADTELKGETMESILVCPVMSSSEKPPLIIWPHGGPHSCAIASFSHYVSTFVVIGCAVLLVNYRGSIGFGEYPLQGLLGKIGLQDVSDVQAFAEAAMKTELFDKSNIFIFGGSHGGFLSAHLVGKYPDFYRACALRNPVINIPAMVEVTDIPDWCYVESGMEYCYEVIPSKDSYCQMLGHSPILYAKNVNCPILILIGGKDCRVPPYQGRSFYRSLKAMDKVVRMHWYPEDSHPLTGTETEADVFINVARWFNIYCNK